NTGQTFQKNNYSNTKLIGMAVSDLPFDWENDQHPRIARQDLIIYEMHIRGFTNHPSSKVTSPGTFSGIIQKIPYFKELGVNALELLPIMEFNESENHNVNPKTKKELCNFWGYSPLSFFSPMQRYASSSNPQESLNECKAMVKALHQAGIEVILDVVFNHTGEGNEKGPVWSWKGFADAVYYLKNGSGEYLNYSGCGNTLNCNHPIVADLIIEALRYWVVEFRVDGFRFDLASILTRGQDGRILESAPLIERITQDPILSHCKLIAEAWDAAGLHQVGSFYQSSWQGPDEWMEWNDDFRSVVRCFLKGTPGYVGRFTTKLCGSEDYYGKGGSPLNSTNYVTCHDGFTLKDLVSYNQKRNKENGEDNRDGMNNNDSWNCGAEGETSNHEIVALRERQMKNFWLALFISAGVPMIMMGDEYGHTKDGNNNSWCQDDDKNWFLWDELESTNSPYRFCKEMIRFRKSCPLLKRGSFYQKQDITWYGKEGPADWSQQSQFIALHIKDHKEGNDLFVAFNAHPQ
ncbi:MAG: glycogen-debranching protein, partial [Verrucomicrobia bacterium]|nr:glycogen-debranching protein [Verrucomicrobiota bacterium]